MFETEGFEPIHGVLKNTPDDFLVEEIPSYPPEGKGEHFYLVVEKVGLNTLDLIRIMSKILDVPRESFGYAGLKDKRARTRQVISVCGVKEKALEKLADQEKFTILEQARHGNKIRIGHLRGNRFTLKVRGCADGDEKKAREMMEVLEKKGMPNSYGEQRFGINETNYKFGRCLVTKNYQKFFQTMYPMSEIGNAISQKKYQQAHEMLPVHQKMERRMLQVLIRNPHDMERAVHSIPQHIRQLYLSAYQSYLFNQYLKERFPTRHQLQIGDIAMKHINGACFLVEDLIEQERYETGEISPSGPIFGFKMLRPTNEPGALEGKILKEEGIHSHDFKLGHGVSQQGARRAIRVFPQEVEIETGQDYLQLKFNLPKGSYATTLFQQLSQAKESVSFVEQE